MNKKEKEELRQIILENEGDRYDILSDVYEFVNRTIRKVLIEWEQHEQRMEYGEFEDTTIKSIDRFLDI